MTNKNDMDYIVYKGARGSGKSITSLIRFIQTLPKQEQEIMFEVLNELLYGKDEKEWKKNITF